VEGVTRYFIDAMCVGNVHDSWENVVSANSRITLEVVRDTGDDVVCSPFLMSVRVTLQRDEVWALSHNYASCLSQKMRLNWRG